MNDALDVLSSAGDYWIVNWRLVQACGGFEEAVIVAYLSSMQNYWIERHQLDSDGMFFCTVNTMRQQTTIEARKQRKVLKRLQGMGIITMKNKGIPAKRYLRVNADVLEDTLLALIE